MKYTAKERKEIHAALVAAKPFLCTGCKCNYSLTEFICHAIEDAGYMPRGGRMASKIIADRLGKRICPDPLAGEDNNVYSWLRDVAKVPRDKLTHENIQAYRHRWLDSLIEEFSK